MYVITYAKNRLGKMPTNVFGDGSSPLNKKKDKKTIMFGWICTLVANEN